MTFATWLVVAVIPTAIFVSRVNRTRSGRPEGRRRSLWAVLAVISVVAAACSSGGTTVDTSPRAARGDTTGSAQAPGAGGATDQDQTGGSTDPESGSEPTGSRPGDGSAPAAAVVGRSVIRFVSSDGSAFVGSRPVFTVTNQKSGVSIPFAVGGAAERTAADLAVEPGTYTITAPEPAIVDNVAYSVSSIDTGEVTVEEPPADGDSIVTVSFGLQAQMAPLDIQIMKITQTSTTLSWTGPDDPTAYVLRVTDGGEPAVDPNEGRDVPLESSASTSVEVTGLQSATDYSFTLFATASDGTQLPYASRAVSTASSDSTAPAYALAPNTVVPSDFDSLLPERISDTQVRVELADGNAQRSGRSPLPGIDAAELEGGCVVGSPFLASYEIAGDDAFHGVIEACERHDDGAASAVVNTDVPLATVIPYLRIVDAATALACFDGTTGEETADQTACAGTIDTDGDGLADSDEALAGTDPEKADTDGDRLSDFEEVSKYGTDPLNVDSDFDLLYDDEITVFGTDPTQADTDGDGCWDYGENNVAGRDPNDPSDAGAECFIPDWRNEVEQRRADYLGEAGGPPDDDNSLDGTSGAASQLAESRPVQVRTGRPFDDLSATPAERLVHPDAASTSPAWAGAWSETAPTRAAVKCERGGNAIIDIVPVVTPITQMRFLEVQKDSVEWNFRAGIKVTIQPRIALQGNYTCSLDLPKFSTQITTSPVPINMEIGPEVSGGATASVNISGPKVELSFGIDSKSWIDIEACCPVPYLTTDTTGYTRPFTSATASGGEVSIEGELSLGVGVDATIGIGIRSRFATASTGFAITLKPLEAKATAKAGNTACAELKLQASVEVALRVEAWVIASAFGIDERFPLLRGEAPYPRANFSLGDCD